MTTLPPPPSASSFTERLTSAFHGDYVAASAIAAAKPWPRHDPEGWWDVAESVREHNHHEGNYPMFPEYGLNRAPIRTYRRVYRGPAGAEIRMPSRSAISRYTARQKGTFDMPIECSMNGADMTGTVRCTEIAPGVWHVTPSTTNPTTAELAAAEAVRSVLEAKRPTTDVNHAIELANKHRQWRPPGTMTTKKVATSSFISSVSRATAKDGKVVVGVRIVNTRKDGTKTDTTYGYLVDADAADEFAKHVESQSGVGAAYNRLIKSSPGVRIEQCSRCGENYQRATGATHVCAAHKPRPAGRRRRPRINPSEAGREIKRLKGAR